MKKLMGGGISSSQVAEEILNYLWKKHCTQDAGLLSWKTNSICLEGVQFVERRKTTTANTNSFKLTVKYSTLSQMFFCSVDYDYIVFTTVYIYSTIYFLL